MLKIFNLRYPKIVSQNEVFSIKFWTFHIMWPFTQYAKLNGSGRTTHVCWFPIGITIWEFKLRYADKQEININIEVGKCQI